MKFIVPLKRCPWCKQTPKMFLRYDDSANTNGTWLWDISCWNVDCKVMPKTKHVSVRKGTKNCVSRLKGKVDLLASYWNSGNDLRAFEGAEINLDDLVDKYIKSKQSERLNAFNS